MKTIVKIDPEKEYNSAKQAIAALGLRDGVSSEISTLDSSVDNLKTVINVLMERATPKKRTRPPKKHKKSQKAKARPEFDKLPSEKFPELEVKENIIKADETPKCSCCFREMSESGLYKSSEKLEVIPKQYFIVRHKRVIYNCRHCHGSMTNAALEPSICSRSNYGDSMIIDVSLSKYCDLIPIERYCAIAARDGLEGLPPNSLIGLTHSLASFLAPVYEKVKAEVLSAQIIMMDETPHRMLEGDTTASWYLWGFSSVHGCIFEAHGSRSGDIPIDFLKKSAARYLLTDGYSGYRRAIRELSAEGKEIEEVFCNAHAYRYFKEASVTWESECEPFLELYGSIYELEREAKTNEQKRIAREKMGPIFSKIKDQGASARTDAMANSAFEKAIKYFSNHFDGLTKCLANIEIPLDNNFSERLLRSPAIGRKIWYGTHSKRGARTNAILFSLVESCKINGINPRNYFAWITERIHTKKEVLTPFQYATQIDSG